MAEQRKTTIPLYTVKQAAEASGFGEVTIRRAIHAHTLRAIRPNPGPKARYKILPADLADWITRMETTPRRGFR